MGNFTLSSHNKVARDAPSQWPTTCTRPCHHGTVATTITDETTIKERLDIILSLYTAVLDLLSKRNAGFKSRAVDAEVTKRSGPLRTTDHVKEPSRTTQNPCIHLEGRDHRPEASTSDHSMADDNPRPWMLPGGDIILPLHQEEADQSRMSYLTTRCSTRPRLA